MKIKKTHRKSFFLKMHINSHLIDSLLEKDPIYKGEYVDVLQIHKFSEIVIIVEVVYQKDHNFTLDSK